MAVSQEKNADDSVTARVEGDDSSKEKAENITTSACAELTEEAS